MRRHQRWSASSGRVGDGLRGLLGAGLLVAGLVVSDGLVLLLGGGLALALICEQVDHRSDRSRAQERGHDRRAELLTVVAAASRTVATLEPARVLESLGDATVGLGFDMAEILVARGDHLNPVVQRGWPPHHPVTGQPSSSGAGGLAYTRGEVVIVGDYQQWEAALPIHRRTGIVRSAIAAPVHADGRTVAVLTAANREPRPVTDEQSECVELLAMQAGIALHNAERFDKGRRLQRELEHQARHDPLTGVANRAHLLAELAQRLTHAPAARTPLSVLFVDLDDFKAVNDRHGHHVGDQVLAVVAARLAEVIRDVDLIARYGGDELVILVDLPLAEIDAVTTRLLTALDRPVEVDAREIRVGASVGVACEEPGDDAETLVRRADAAMYATKRARTPEHPSGAAPPPPSGVLPALDGPLSGGRPQ